MKYQKVKALNTNLSKSINEFPWEANYSPKSLIMVTGPAYNTKNILKPTYLNQAHNDISLKKQVTPVHAFNDT